MSDDWISVKERTPDPFVDVLVWASSNRTIAFEKGDCYIAVDRWCVWDDGFPAGFRTDRFFGKALFWMSMPKPPIGYEINE